MSMSTPQDAMGRPSEPKRPRTRGPDPVVKRPVGRPRKRPLWEGTSVQLGSFVSSQSQ
jgi:hypothetical protein